MKVYWRSKEKTTAPPGAQFFLYPFSKQEPLLIPTVLSHLPEPSPPLIVLNRTDLPERKQWRVIVKKALEEIRRGKLKKVVLARETALVLDSPPDPFRIAAALEKKTEGASLFCLDLGKGNAFLGASPERLFSRKDNTIKTEAIAGTRRRDKEDELLHSEKELREFQFVQDYLAVTLSPFCEQPLSFSSRKIHRTATVCHLFAEGEGKLLSTAYDRHLIEALSPTPALCGTPKQEAFGWIEREEPFTRGFYGGVIGWSAPEQSDWMVAIRCLALEGKSVKLYTGTGIVEGSDPDAEWDELEAKLSLYKEIFSCGL